MKTELYSYWEFFIDEEVPRKWKSFIIIFERQSKKREFIWGSNRCIMAWFLIVNQLYRNIEYFTLIITLQCHFQMCCQILLLLWSIIKQLNKGYIKITCDKALLFIQFLNIFKYSTIFYKIISTYVHTISFQKGFKNITNSFLGSGKRHFKI